MGLSLCVLCYNGRNIFKPDANFIHNDQGILCQSFRQLESACFAVLSKNATIQNHHPTLFPHSPPGFFSSAACEGRKQHSLPAETTELAPDNGRLFLFVNDVGGLSNRGFA